MDAAVSAGNQLSTWSVNNGLAVVLLLLFIIGGTYFGWKILYWLAINIITPIRDAIISHLKTTDEFLQNMSETMREFEATLKTIREDLLKTNQMSDRIAELERKTDAR